MIDTFIQHPFIKSIAAFEKWTISNNQKIPIDMTTFLSSGKVYGSSFSRGYNPLTDLYTIAERLPTVVNCTYYAQMLSDQFVILDIEPTCPEDIVNKLLEMPYLYGEVSMSGHGYHLIFPMPSNVEDFSDRINKPAAKEEHGHYELLLNHYVTLTGNMLEKSTNERPNDTSFDEFFTTLMSTQAPVIKTAVDLSSEKPEIPLERDIVNVLKGVTYGKKQVDVKSYNRHTNTYVIDYSKWEYGYIGLLYNKMIALTEIKFIKDTHTYNQNEKVWILYLVASEIIPKRDKHNETRHGVPWLMYLCKEIVGKSEPNIEPKE